MAGYIKSLDGVRALAILLVMAFHVEIIHYGWMGVQLFFVLSGFLITGILWKDKFAVSTVPGKLKKFWVRRSLRIFPLYFGYLSLFGISYVAFHFPGYYRSLIPYLASYTFNFTRTSKIWEQTPLFTHLWSLCVEEQFYLFFPLIVFFFPPRWIKGLMVVVIFLSPISRYFLGEYYKSKGLLPAVTADAVYWNTLSHLDAFFMGGIIPVLGLDKKIRRPQRLLLVAGLLVLVAGMINFGFSLSQWPYLADMGYSHGRVGNYEHVWHYTLLNIFFASFLLMLVSPFGGRVVRLFHRVLELDWLVRIGKVSYGMYIFHWAVYYYFYDRLFHSDKLLLNILFFIPYAGVVYGVAWVSYRWYESWFIALKDRFFPTGGEVIAVPTNSSSLTGR